MSEMSSLSHEYASTSDFSRELNDAVLVLKRNRIGTVAPERKHEVEEAAKRVRDVLAQLLVRLDESAAAPEHSGDIVIPEDVIARIECDHQDERTCFLVDLRRLAASLAPGANIEPRDFDLLDSLCTAADASASATFRKLWRR